MWVLLKAYNQYDQYGGYFVAVWSNKPTEEQITSLKLSVNVAHLLAGGGRVQWEEEWYVLLEVEAGKDYHHEQTYPLGY